MNRGQMISRVQNAFGDTSEAQITRLEIIDWLNEGQLDVARKTEALKQHAETNALSSTGSYDLPVDFIKIDRVSFDGKKLQRTTLQELDHYNADRDTSNPTGIPNQFYTYGRTITVYPAPPVAGSGNLDIWYIKAPPNLDDDTDESELPVFLHDDIWRFALARAKEKDEEFDQSASIMADYELRLLQSRDDVQHQGNDSYPAVRPLVGDDY